MKPQKRTKRQLHQWLIALVLMIAPLFVLSSCKGRELLKASPEDHEKTNTEHSIVVDEKITQTTATTVDTVDLAIKVPSIIEHLLSLEAICEAKEFKWTSIEIISTLDKHKIECMVRANERLSSFTPLIIYAHGPVEIRKAKEGREFFFEKKLPQADIEVTTSDSAAPVLLQIRENVKKRIPMAKMELVTSDDKTGSSALRISTTETEKIIPFIAGLNAHIYRIELLKKADGTKSMTVELEAVSSKSRE